MTYLSSNQGSFGTIPQLVSQGLLDSRFLGSVSGYNFTVAASGPNYTANADPTSVNAGRLGTTAFQMPSFVSPRTRAGIAAPAILGPCPAHPYNSPQNCSGGL